MKNYSKNILVSLVSILISVASGAQVLKGSYFLDSSVNRHKMNPAFAPRANYFQLPLVGNVGAGIYTNLNASTFWYPLENGKLGSFLHPSVSVKEFDRNLPNRMCIDAEVSTTLLSFGWFTRNKAFWNFTLDMNGEQAFDFPTGIFMFLKKGTGAGKSGYDLASANGYTSAAVRASLGYSREIIDGLRAGIKVRAVFPAGYIGEIWDDMTLTASEESWRVDVDGKFYDATPGLVIRPDSPITYDPAYMIEYMVENKRTVGVGYSVDLGAEYVLNVGCPVDGLTFSAAVTDLGSVFYKDDGLRAYAMSGSMEWKGINAGWEDMDALWDEFLEELKEMGKFSELDLDGKLVRSTMPRFYAGVEMPFLSRKMSVGLLYSSRLIHKRSRHELTASFNLKPAKWFALGLNYSFLNTRKTMGAILELTPKVGPAFYIGCDYFPMELYENMLLEEWLGETPDILKSYGFSSWPCPTTLNFNLNFGLAFNLGSKYANPKKNKQ